MLHHFQGGQIAFFEIAATLIPILVFGGVVSERLLPPTGRWGTIHFGIAWWAVPGAGLFAIFAEILAIQSIVTGEVDALARYVVSAAVVGGMVGVVTAIWWPWLRDAQRAQHKSLSVGDRRLLVAGALAVSLLAVILLASAVKVAKQKEDGAALLHAFHRSTTKLEAARERLGVDEEKEFEIGQKLEAAEQRHEPERTIRGLLRQQTLFIELAGFDAKTESRLFAENVNLYRRVVGLPSLAEEESSAPGGS